MLLLMYNLAILAYLVENFVKRPRLKKDSERSTIVKLDFIE